jgi:hypothetical protein
MGQRLHHPSWEIVAASVAAAIVTAKWISHAARALHQGMTHIDTLMYHGPFAARFLQKGTFTNLRDLAGTSPFIPQNSELLHAVAAVPYHRDLLSPLLNLGWAALVVLAAWCVGRRLGAGVLCVLGVMTVLGLPSLAGTQPGQASNDVVCAALLVTAVALLLESQLTPTTAALAGAAAGLAVATKLTVAAPVVVLTVGLVLLSLRLRRTAVALSWCSALVLAGSYWFVRNWIVAGDPAPFLKVTIGPISFRGSAPFGQESAVHYLTNGTVWQRSYLPGLSHALGPAWPLVLSLGLCGAAFAIFWGRTPLERLVALAALAGMCAYPFIPNTGVFRGVGFVFNLRYLMPALLLAFILLPPSLVRLHIAWRRVACFAMLGLVVLSTALPAIPGDGMPAWPSDGVASGVVAAIVVLAVIAWALRIGSPLRMAAARLALIGALAVAALIAVGWFLQLRYFEGRYAGPGLAQSETQTPFRGIRLASVAVFGTPTVYAMFGPDLSNRVTAPMVPTHEASLVSCQQWKRVLSRRYRYVVLGHFAIPAFTLPQTWFLTDPAAVPLVRTKDYAVFRLDRPLNPGLCTS